MGHRIPLTELILASTISWLLVPVSARAQDRGDSLAVWGISAPAPPGPRFEGRPHSDLRLSTAQTQAVERVDFDFDRREVSSSWELRDVPIVPAHRAPADEHLLLLARAKTREAWRESARLGLRVQPGQAEETLLGGITSIDLPIQFPSAVSSIIGQGANIELTASEDISFGGESNYIVEQRDYGFGQRSRFPQLDMHQHLRMNVNGTIGEKIHILVDHDSEVQTALENKIKLRYVGDEDEVIQSIEMGNTNLSLGGASFVGYSGQAQGLFGAKMVGQMAGLEFTAIASKQEGKTSRQTFVGRAKEEAQEIRDLDYEKRRFYTLRLPLGDVGIPDFAPIESLSVWVDDRNAANDEADGAKPGVAYLSIDDGDTSAVQTLGKWVEWDPIDDYLVNYDLGVIELQRPIPGEHSLAVVYNAITPPGPLNPDTLRTRIGSSDGDTLHLQMVHPANFLTNNWNPGTEWYPLLKMELKHVYFLGARDIARTDYTIVVRQRTTEGVEVDQQGGVPFIRLMGLDRGTYTETSSDPDTPDGIVDPQFISFASGFLIFPNYQPFDPDPALATSEQSDYSLTVRNEELYQQSEEYLRIHSELQRYIIEAKYRTPQTTFNLGQFGIIRDSEVVSLNGRRLARGTDYQIDYDLGQVTFLTEEASRADAQIAIDYEYASLLAQAQKTLFGMNGNYKFSETDRVGVTWLFETSTTPERRPRLGQEPTRTLLGDMNFQFQRDSGALTRLTDRLPLLRTESGSRFQLSGEAASSVPNPNTKNEVYIDDMDGSEDVRSLGITWRQWLPASTPVGFGDTTLAYRPNWYNPRDKVREKDLFLGLTGIEGGAYRTVLELRAHPDEAAIADPSAWVGIMRLISREGANFSEQKFLEIWVENGVPAERKGSLHIDLGDINEDFYRPGASTEPDDEDTSDDSILDEVEDIGLDRVEAADEAALPGDDGNDDFDYDYERDRSNYLKINGSERNRIRDSEDLNGNGFLDTKDGYFTVEVDLSNAENPYVAVDNADSTQAEVASSWRLFRIPLFEAFDPEVGSGGPAPTWRAIRYARLRFEGFAPGERVLVGSLEVVGNSWLEDGIHDAAGGGRLEDDGTEDFSVQVRNNKEHSEYTPPFEVEEQQTPQGRFQRREQSIALVYEDLEGGHFGGAHKAIVQSSDRRLNDYSEYKDLSFYVRPQRLGSFTEPPVFFVRFGGDSANFYEYRTVLDRPGEWRSVNVPIDRIPQLKLQPADSVMDYNNALHIDVRDPDLGAPVGSLPAGGESFAVYGQPSLTRILYLQLGVRNPHAAPIEGEIWVDELRLREVRRESGLATQLNGSFQLADLASFNGSLRRTDSEFRTLGGARSGAEDVNLSAGGRLNLHKFIEDTGLALPVSYNYSESDRQPRLLTGSDIVLDGAQRRRERSFSVNRSVSMAASHPSPSKHIVGKLLLDGLQTNVSLGRSDRTSPEQIGSTRDLRGSLQYNVGPPFEPQFDFRGARIGYLPETAGMRIEGSRVEDRQWNVETDRTRGPLRVDRTTREIQGVFNLRAVPFEAGSMSTDYDFEMVRDMDSDKTARARKAFGWGNEIRRRQSGGWRYQPSLFGLMTPLLTYDASFDENQSPQFRRPEDPPGLRQVQNSGEFRATTSVSLYGMLNKADGWRQRRVDRKRREAEAPPRREEGAPPPEERATPEEEGIVPGEGGMPDEFLLPDKGFRVPPDRVEETVPFASEPPDTSTTPSDTSAAPADTSGLAPEPPAPVEPAAAPAAPASPLKKSGPGLLHRVTRASQRLQDISVNFTRRRSSRYQRALERPGLAYQFGFDLGGPQDAAGSLAGQTASSISRSRGLSLRSGVRPVTGANLDVRYDNTASEQDAAGSVSENLSTTWPDLALSVSSLEKWKAIAGVVERASLNSTFRRKNDETRSGGVLRDRKSQLSFSPLFQVSTTLKNDVQLTLTANHSRSTNDNLRGVGSVNRTLSSNVSLGARFAVRPKSGSGSGSAAGSGRTSAQEIKISGDLRYTQETGDRRTGGQTEWEKVNDTSGFSFEPRADYSFNRNMTGGARAIFGQTMDHKRGETRRRIGLWLNLSLRF